MLSDDVVSEILNSIVKIEWDRGPGQGVTVYFENDPQPYDTATFHEGSFTREIMLSIDDFISGILGIPKESSNAGQSPQS